MTTVKSCKVFGKSKQAYYKTSTDKVSTAERESRLLKFIQEKRLILPKMGGRKLHNEIKVSSELIEFSVGRDALFSFLKQRNLLIKRKKRYARTTNSNHWYKKYKNEIKGIEIVRKNQVFVSDITYIKSRNGFLYLSLITDLYSHKIMGYNLSKNLKSEGCIVSLRMALKNVKHPENLIHHSDRGIQYCSYDYTDILKTKKIKISMTEENHCYENAVAERLNGILKDEFFLYETFASYRMAKYAVEESIKLYNEVRTHYSIKLKTPAEVYAA